MIKEPYLITLEIKKNEKSGFLIPINNFELDMDIKRIFYIYGFTENIEKNSNNIKTLIIRYF